ncbi:MAG: outer membrane protein assembly factor BamE [Acidiferrobacterales bacterium]
MSRLFGYVIGLLLLAAFMSGCIRIYLPDVQQGNVITQEMVDKLKPGMTRRQVQFVLGTPLITDSFHQNRWDYYYSYKRGKEYRTKRKVSLFFKDDKLIDIRGTVQPRPKEPVTAEVSDDGGVLGTGSTGAPFIQFSE